jgi:hypothetical protein
MNDHRDYLPALSMFKFRDGRPRPWAVTVNDDYYGPDAESVCGIVTFDTEEEAEAFILAEQRRQSAVAPL